MGEPTMVQVHVVRRIGNTIEYLALRRSHKEDIYPGVWQVVTGMIEPNETAQDAARRELFEEAGLRPVEFYCLPFITSFFSTRRNQVQHVPVFAAIVNADEDVVLSEEHSEFQWGSFDEVINLLPFPSHKEGTKVFKEYVIDSESSGLFRVNIN